MSPSPTPGWYSTHAAAFCARTFVIDMEDARTRFLRHVPAGGRILDVGCGSGRDSKRFAELGYAVDARDRSHEIANEAARRTGLAVRVEDVLAMEDRASFDGIWASAMLIHLDDADFDEAVRRLARAVRPGGVLYISLKESERANTLFAIGCYFIGVHAFRHTRRLACSAETSAAINAPTRLVASCSARCASIGSASRSCGRRRCLSCRAAGCSAGSPCMRSPSRASRST